MAHIEKGGVKEARYVEGGTPLRYERAIVALLRGITAAVMVIVRSPGDYAFGVNHATWGVWCGCR